jgi:hypothetical protein
VRSGQAADGAGASEVARSAHSVTGRVALEAMGTIEFVTIEVAGS